MRLIYGDPHGCTAQAAAGSRRIEPPHAESGTERTDSTGLGSDFQRPVGISRDTKVNFAPPQCDAAPRAIEMQVYRSRGVHIEDTAIFQLDSPPLAGCAAVIGQPISQRGVADP